MTLSREDISVYLQDRAEKGFNVVMADFEFQKRRSESEWEKAEFVLHEAARRGLYVVVVAGWGGTFRNLSASEMHDLGRALGSRCVIHPNVIYFAAAEFYKIKGKLDGQPLEAIQIEKLQQLARGIRSADDDHLISIHGFPDRGVVGQPSTYFQYSEWCDFYAVQTHNFQEQIRTAMTRDWHLKDPIKPTLNAEGGYEGCDRELHPWLKRKQAVSLFDSGWGQRFQAYWSVFFGSCGYAYGHDLLWCMTDPNGIKGKLHRPALSAPGALTMRHLRALMQDRIATAVPDATLIVSDPGSDVGGDLTPPPNLICAIRDAQRNWALVYSTLGDSFTIDLSGFKSSERRARWFNPRDGSSKLADSVTENARQTFDPPGSSEIDNDWVLIIETKPSS
jgi:hypothetical protein